MVVPAAIRTMTVRASTREAVQLNFTARPPIEAVTMRPAYALQIHRGELGLGRANPLQPTELSKVLLHPAPRTHRRRPWNSSNWHSPNEGQVPNLKNRRWFLESMASLAPR